MASALTSMGGEKLPTVEPKIRIYPKPVWLSILLARYVREYRQYRKTGSTPYGAALDLRRLCRLTNGRFNDLDSVQTLFDRDGDEIAAVIV